MSKVVFIKQNSPEVRKKLEDVGYRVCACATFVGAVWLDYYPDDEKLCNSVHGTGYTDETDGEYINRLPPLERIKVWLSWENYYSKKREFYDTVEDFLSVYPKPKSNN